MFEANRHTPCTDTPWQPDKVSAAIHQSFAATEEYLLNKRWRQIPEDALGATTLYQGGLGMLWSLQYLSHALDRPLDFDVQSLALEIYDDFDQFEGVRLAGLGVPNFSASYFGGKTGALNALQKLVPERYSEYQQQLLELARLNMTNPTLEALWGAPGTILPILNNLERAPTNEALAGFFVEQLEILKNQMSFAEDFACWVWIQDLYGGKRRLLGAAHGFAGNVYPFLRGQDFLPKQLQDWLLETTTDTLLKTVTVEGDLANWQSSLDGSDRGRPAFLVQWCHGAPGVITSVNNIPAGYSAELDALLLKAGETIWRAGPLQKGLGLCHGTDGNGYALLKLYERTGDSLWLDRARSFAMHCLTLDQTLNQSRAGVWEGGGALPLYLLACQSGVANMPLWDFV